MKVAPTNATSLRCLRRLACQWHDTPQTRFVHSTCTKAAIAHPINVHGPPPKPPVPAPEYESLERRRRKLNLINERAGLSARDSNPLKRRFWKDVNVTEVEDGYQVLLDTRPVRTPAKQPLVIPNSKPQLAHAIALEWDLLESAQQALKSHRIPMTSLAARALDIAAQDARNETTTRNEIVNTLMRYLDTDTLLSWAPATNLHDPSQGEGSQETLRDLQIRTAQPIIGFLVNRVWPGLEFRPTFDEDSIMPVPQRQETKDVLMGWMAGLPAFEMAGLERAALASKSYLVAARLVIEWSENFRDLQPAEDPRRFGIEDAAEASSLEVSWQTGRWGEVEDTHDVEKEDLRRQLGSVVLLVSGEKNR